MSVALLDVNVLVALFDPLHVHYEPAHQWLAGHGRKRWATCPLTIHGCIRVLSRPGYPTLNVTPSEVASRLRIFCGKPNHEFWADEVSLLDESRFRIHKLTGSKQITDTYLLGLAVSRNGQLVTFDRSVALESVFGAQSSHLNVIRPSRSM